jgi:hypothetical protein
LVVAIENDEEIFASALVPPKKTIVRIPAKTSNNKNVLKPAPSRSPRLFIQVKISINKMATSFTLNPSKG